MSQSATPSPGAKVDWAAVQQAVAQTMPVCMPWIESLSYFVEHNSGGPDGELLKELGDFVKCFHGSCHGMQRAIGGEFFDNVNSLQRENGVRFPYVKNALIEASPCNKMIASICRLLVPSNLTELTNKRRRADVERCEQIMTSARDRCKGLHLSSTDRIKFCGLLDIRLMLHLLKTGKDLETRTFASLDEIVQKFVTDLSASVGHAVTLSGVSMTTPPESLEPGASATSNLSSNIETVQEMQNPVFQPRKAGFVIGSMLEKVDPEDQSVWVLLEYLGLKVVLQQREMGVNIGERLCIDVAELLGKYKLHRGSLTTLLPRWAPERSIGDPLHSKLWKFECVKGAINVAVKKVNQELRLGVNDMDLFIRPNIVKMRSAWPAGELMIAPATYSATHRRCCICLRCLRTQLIRVTSSTHIHGWHRSGTSPVSHKVQNQCSS